MRDALVVLSNPTIGSNHRERFSHDALDVILTHSVINHPGSAGEIHLENLIYLTVEILFLFDKLRDLSNRFAIECFVRVIRSDNSEIIVFKSAALERVFHIGDNTLTSCFIGQTLLRLLQSSSPQPRRKSRIKRG